MGKDFVGDTFAGYKPCGCNAGKQDVGQLANEYAFKHSPQIAELASILHNAFKAGYAAASPNAVELIDAYDEYIKLLSNNPAESIAFVHGFEHSKQDIEKGTQLREKISLLKQQFIINKAGNNGKS
jgi:Tat protein secretion system quality control protein TatD with DNase activity